MTPEERQLISGLFDRMKPAASQSRDREAEAFISDAVRAQPYAPYLLSQTVIVQDQALRAANEKIQQLEAQVRQQPPHQEDTSFLGGLGKSIFGSGEPEQPRPTVPTTGGHGPAPLPQEPGPFRGQGYPGAQPQGPWGQAAGAAGGIGSAMGGGGGFLKGALGAAAGVAGGVLLADGIRGLFGGGNNPYGIASGFGGGGFGGGGFGNPGGETIVNNYYDSPDQGVDSPDYGGDAQGVGDFGGDAFDPGTDGGDFGGGGDFGNDV